MGVVSGADEYFAQMSSDEIQAEIRRLREERDSKDLLIIRGHAEPWRRRQKANQGAASHYKEAFSNGA